MVLVLYSERLTETEDIKGLTSTLGFKKVKKRKLLYKKFHCSYSATFNVRVVEMGQSERRNRNVHEIRLKTLI
jgi:hypothetical protein